MSPDPTGERPVAPLDLMETDRRIARYHWLENRRFEVLGGWAAAVPEVEVKALFAVQAHHHAWHASLWSAHLPQRSGSTHDHLADAAGDLAAWAQALDSPSGGDATPLRLVGAYRVTAAHAIATYGGHLARASAVSDAALVRTCRLVLGDQVDDWRDGEQVLLAHLRTDDDIDRAAAHQARLERLLLAAGGIAGAGREPPD